MRAALNDLTISYVSQGSYVIDVGMHGCSEIGID